MDLNVLFSYPVSHGWTHLLVSALIKVMPSGHSYIGGSVVPWSRGFVLLGTCHIGYAPVGVSTQHQGFEEDSH